VGLTGRGPAVMAGFDGDRPEANARWGWLHPPA
jgi:hypothetical protein